jgi:hypothetical protein
VFNFATFENIDIINTHENPKGVVAVNSDSKLTVLAYPDETKGYVRVKSYEKAMTALINAHNCPVACISLNNDGTLVATASENVNFYFILRELLSKFIK